MNNLIEKVSNLEEHQNPLNLKLVSVNALINTISDNVEAHDDHMTNTLLELDKNLERNFTLQLKNSYGYNTSYTCGGTGGWRRVVYLDMTDPNTTCPSGWHLSGLSKTLRTCGIHSRTSTQLYSLSVEESTLECVVESKVISYFLQMHLRLTILVTQPLSMMPMLVVVV